MAFYYKYLHPPITPIIWFIYFCRNELQMWLIDSKKEKLILHVLIVILMWNFKSEILFRKKFYWWILISRFWHTATFSLMLSYRWYIIGLKVIIEHWIKHFVICMIFTSYLSDNLFRLLVFYEAAFPREYVNIYIVSTKYMYADGKEITIWLHIYKNLRYDSQTVVKSHSFTINFVSTLSQCLFFNAKKDYPWENFFAS